VVIGWSNSIKIIFELKSMGKLSPKSFVNVYAPHANLVAENTKVPSLVTLTQAALESGWNQHAPQYNFFGMTAGSSWSGKTQTLTNAKGQKIKYRAYDSAAEAFADYANNLATRSSYKAAFQYINNPELFLKKVVEGGYTTDAGYYTLCLSVMKNIKKYVV
jgi:flagellum-specific peptidoglycan hydrolase FlgJ